MCAKKANPTLISFALGFVGKKELKEIQKVSKDCKAVAAKTLRGILNYAKDTEWGKAHNFRQILQTQSDASLYEMWQENVPPADYEDFRPFVERHKKGEENILFPGRPKMYATTSGTTNAPKWIPVTNEYYENVYQRMTHLWMYSFMMHRKDCFKGPAVSIVGKAVEGYAPDGTVYGSISGVTRRDVPEFMLPLHSAPADVFDIEDYNSRYYTIMRIALEQDVHILITPNPSTILEMQNNVNNNFKYYVEDIATGKLNSKLNIPADIRAKLEPLFKPNPMRSDELKELKEKYGTLLPKHYWPNMRVLTTWKCGNTKIYMGKFKDSFPENMLYQEFSYFASECRTGLVLNGGDDTVLFPHFHYFEFVEESELERENPKFKQIYELEVGKRYSIFITTYAGLYRYNMNDLIEVTGFYGTIPTIQFLQKINGIVSMTGEKVHERQFIEAVKSAEADTGIKTHFFVGFADVENSVYQVYYEFENPTISEESIIEFNDRVDENLKKVNIEYESKRDSNRVKKMNPHILRQNSFETFKQYCLKKGFRDGQFKLNLLMQDEKRRAIFNALVKKD